MKKAPNKKKLHHFVPKFYLNHFGTNTESNEKKIYIKKLSNGKVFSNITKQTATENNFHTIDNDPYFEDVLMRYETEWASIHNKIINQKSLSNLTDLERKKYAQFIGFLVVRTASYREWALKFARLVISARMSDNPSQINKNENIILYNSISNILSNLILTAKEQIDNTSKQVSINIDYKGILDNIQNNLQNELAPIIETGIVSGSYKIDLERNLDQVLCNIKKVHILKMEEIGNIVTNNVQSMNWILNENNTGKLFITSNNPVGVFPLKDLIHNKRKSNEDIIKYIFNLKGKVDWYLPNDKPNTDISIILPLNPNLILLGGHSSSPLECNSVINISNPGTIDIYNLMTTIQAQEYIYSKSEIFENHNHISVVNEITKSINDIISKCTNK